MTSLKLTSHPDNHTTFDFSLPTADSSTPCTSRNTEYEVSNNYIPPTPAGMVDGDYVMFELYAKSTSGLAKYKIKDADDNLLAEATDVSTVFAQWRTKPIYIADITKLAGIKIIVENNSTGATNVIQANSFKMWRGSAGNDSDLTGVKRHVDSIWIISGNGVFDGDVTTAILGASSNSRTNSDWSKSSINGLANNFIWSTNTLQCLFAWEGFEVGLEA